MPLKPGHIIGGTPLFDEASPRSTSGYARHHAVDGEILIVPIQSDPPAADQAGLEISLNEKRSIGLPTEAPSYVIVSEVNIDS
jgi:hypothetical protein